MAPKGCGKQKNKSAKKRTPNRLEHLNTVPDVIDFIVRLPNDKDLEVRCVSTDKLADIRIILAELPECCHLTNYSFRNVSRGDELNNDVEVAVLKPNVVVVREELYTEKTALHHVQRFIDIFTCTNLLGPSAKKKPKPVNSWLCDSKSRKKKIASLTPSKFKETARAESGGMWEEPRLDDFYAFFSFGNLAKPINGVEMVENSKSGDNFFQVEVDVNGDRVQIYACEEGFYTKLDPDLKHKSIVSLLVKDKECFGQRYQALLDKFSSRNQFGNPPLGLRANTWVVPQCLAESQGKVLLPTEAESLGGQIGGFTSEGKERNWYQEFLENARMPGSNPAERVTRDRKVFLLHTHFVDTAIMQACKHARDASDDQKGQELRDKNLVFSLEREATQISVNSGAILGMSNTERYTKSEVSLIKGLTADENTVARDVDKLATVKVHFNGFEINVKADESAPMTESWTLDEEPALHHYDKSALNLHGFRELCNVNPKAKQSPSYETLKSVLADVLLEEEVDPPLLRWEIISSWLQHLKNPPSEGPGSIPLKSFNVNRRILLGKDARSGSDQGEAELRAKLGDSSWNNLAKLNIGLHRKSTSQLLSEGNRYYAEIALPRIVHDFESLELSPIDGQTLTDFMHSRGINMRHVGRLASLSKSLMHVYSLCIQEMVTRAFKRVLRAIMTKCRTQQEKTNALAGALNSLLGSKSAQLNTEVWDWVHNFVKKRFEFVLPPNTRSDIRHVALLRDLCQRVGIEVAPRYYDYTLAEPFKPSDIVAIVPVCRYIQFASADGKQMLEHAKSALDKGKLDEAVTASTSALSKMCLVCGANHCASASAFSLLAVVLYHTGAFLQAAIYQQKALAVNEREYGLDHPDTIKSYGDLAVFFYRLQHTELALFYVSRALYLLHLTCGADHPNTAATYINVAMMEEGLGNIHVALRYLQEALHCNQKLLGPDHVQTAASYHAIAIAVSLMEPPLYMLSVQHEQTTLDILEQKLGHDDLRTQDAAAWLEYFDSKAVEAQEAAKSGQAKPDCNIACKGHLPVKDLMKFILDESSENALKGKASTREATRTPDSTLYGFNSSVGTSEHSSSNSDSDRYEGLHSSETDEHSEGEDNVQMNEAQPPKAVHEELVQKIAYDDEDSGEWVCVESNGKGRKHGKKANSKKRGKPRRESNDNMYKRKGKGHTQARSGKAGDFDKTERARPRSSFSSNSSEDQYVIVAKSNVQSLTKKAISKDVHQNNISLVKEDAEKPTSQAERSSPLKSSAASFYPVSARKGTSFNPNAQEFIPHYLQGRDSVGVGSC